MCELAVASVLVSVVSVVVAGFMVVVVVYWRCYSCGFWMLLL